MIPLSSINLDGQERHFAISALEQGWISGTGMFVSQFEQALAEKIGAKHALAVTNGTHALELALKVLPTLDHDEVIVPALTFVAPAAAVRALGAKPVFADVTEESWTINPDEIERVHTINTNAVIAVDLIGHPCDYNKIWEMRDYLDFRIIEDAAEAHGAHYHDMNVGEMGDISTFSFHANKTITTGEGGAVLTDSDYLAETSRLIANHGMTKARPYWHEVIGSNYRMTNITAAIGLGQVARWDELVDARKAVAAAYDERLADLFQKGSLHRRPVASWATEAPWLYTVHHSQRELYLNELRKADVDARAIWPALPDLPLYRDSVRGEYPIARKIAAEAFWLPTWAGMPIEHIDYICEAIHAAEKQLRADFAR